MSRERAKRRAMLPKGVATFLPEATRLKRRIEESILGVFSQWGYQEVVPPIFEYLDVIGPGLGEDLVEKGYKFVDRSSGRLMLLRPDVTPQIARMVGTLLAEQPKPLRLCYRANVFRHEDEHAGRAREIFQIGGELAGLDGPEGDAEMIAIAIESMRRLGLKEFRVALGQVEFFRALIGLLGAEPEMARRIGDAVGRKDTALLGSLLQGASIESHLAQAILAVPRLFGGEEVLDRAENLVLSAECGEALERLRAVYRLLHDAGWGDFLVIDLGDLRGFDYYTGIIFEVFAPDVGFALGRGGRYDHLVAKFGAPCHATGFAFDLEHLQLVLQRAAAEVPAGAADLILVEESRPTERLFALAQRLRAHGLRVALMRAGTPLAEALALARSQGIAAVVMLSDGGARVTNVASGRQKSTNLKRLVQTVETLRS